MAFGPDLSIALPPPDGERGAEQIRQAVPAGALRHDPQRMILLQEVDRRKTQPREQLRQLGHRIHPVEFFRSFEQPQQLALHGTAMQGLHQQHSARFRHPRQFGDDRFNLGDELDHADANHHIKHAVREWQGPQIPIQGFQAPAGGEFQTFHREIDAMDGIVVHPRLAERADAAARVQDLFALQFSQPSMDVVPLDKKTGVVKIIGGFDRRAVRGGFLIKILFPLGIAHGCASVTLCNRRFG